MKVLQHKKIVGNKTPPPSSYLLPTLYPHSCKHFVDTITVTAEYIKATMSLIDPVAAGKSKVQLYIYIYIEREREREKKKVVARGTRNESTVFSASCLECSKLITPFLIAKLNPLDFPFSFITFLRCDSFSYLVSLVKCGTFRTT